MIDYFVQYQCTKPLAVIQSQFFFGLRPPKLLNFFQSPLTTFCSLFIMRVTVHTAVTINTKLKLHTEEHGRIGIAGRIDKQPTSSRLFPNVAITTHGP